MIDDDYSNNWYDALDMDEQFHSYYFTAPKKDGDLLITAETYSTEIIPTECTTIDPSVYGEGHDTWL